MFRFEFNLHPTLLGITQDSLKLFNIVQIGSTDTKNSWFFDNFVIEDGRMFGILPVLKSWIFLSLYAKCYQAKSVFISLDDMLESLEESSEEEEVDLQVISMILKVNQLEIESFLMKLMPYQSNLEGNIGFKYEQSSITDSLYDLIKNQSLDDSLIPEDTKYFEDKWNQTSSTVVILDNLQFYLPIPIFTALCSKFNLHPISPEDLQKRPKITESFLLKPIKSAKEAAGTNNNMNMTPTDDYTKFESKFRPEKVKNSKFAVTGNTSMLNFFKKAQ